MTDKKSKPKNLTDAFRIILEIIDKSGQYEDESKFRDEFQKEQSSKNEKEKAKNAKEQEANNLKIEIQNTNQGIINIQKEVDELIKKIDELKSTQQNKNNEKNSLEQEIDSIIKQVDPLKTENEKIDQEIKKDTQTLNETQNQIKILNQNKEDLETKIKGAEPIIEKQNKQIPTLESKSESLKKDLEEKKEQLKNAKQTKPDLKQKQEEEIKKLTGEKDKLEDQLDQIEELVKKNTKKKGKLEKSLAEIQEERSQKENKMKEIEDSNKKILEEIKESKQSLQKEKDRLKKKRDKLAQKIPFQVRLCSIDDEGKWNLDKLGLTILEDIKSKIRILTLVEVDSNDNFALSNMFFPPNTHKISSKSDNPEIWMFKPRKFSLNSEEKLIILDVRGFNTNKLEQSIQSKIFSFLIFISSLIVLRTSTSQNNLTIDLIKNFSSIQHPHAFQFTSFQHPILSSRISPNLLWVFNKETPQSSPDFFLKEFMAQNKDSSKKSEIRESNKIKKSLFDFYRNIQGFGISSDSENRGFDLGVLSSKIYSLLFDKYIDNSEIRILSEFQFLDGALLVSVIEEYMQKANVSDSILDFQVIYDSSIENQNKKAQEISIREYKQQLLTKFSEETQPTEQDILDWHFQYFQPKKLLPTKLVGNLNQRLQCLKNITDNISEIHSKLSFKIKSQDLFLKMSDQKKKKEISNLIDTQIKSRAIGDEFSNEYSFLDFKSFQSFPELQTSLEKMAQRYFQNSQESRRLRNFTKFIDWFKRFEKKFSNLNGYDPKWDENIKKFGKEMEEKMKQKKKEENDFFQILETIDSVEFILFWLEEMCQNLKDFSDLRSNHLDAKQTNLKNANLGTTKEKIKSADNEFYVSSIKSLDEKIQKFKKIHSKTQKEKEKQRKKQKEKQKEKEKDDEDDEDDENPFKENENENEKQKEKEKQNENENEKEKEKENENEKEKQKQKQKQKEKQKQKQKQNENEKEKQNENPFDEDDEDDSPFNEDDENENEKEKQNEKQNENEKEKQKDENPFDEDDEDDSPFNEDEDEDEKEKEKQNEKQKENEKEKEKQKEKQNQNQKENDENLFDEDDEDDDDDEDLFSDSKK